MNDKSQEIVALPDQRHAPTKTYAGDGEPLPSVALPESSLRWPKRDSLKKWGVGVGLAILPVVYGVLCIFSRHAILLSDGGGEPLDVYGDAAIALGIACIAAGIYIHAEWYLAVHRSLWVLSDPLKIGACVAVVCSIGFATFKIVA
jgi:hypothetical protein